MLGGVELYKSSILEKYVGRLSSILILQPGMEIQRKRPGAGGIGPLDARLTIEGPLFNEKQLSW
jgi:hypothetical protein